MCLATIVCGFRQCMHALALVFGTAKGPSAEQAVFVDISISIFNLIMIVIKLHWVNVLLVVIKLKKLIKSEFTIYNPNLKDKRMQSKIKTVDAQINLLAASREMEAYCGYCSRRMSTSNLLGHYKASHKSQQHKPFATSTPMATFFAHMNYPPDIGRI